MSGHVNCLGGEAECEENLRILVLLDSIDKRLMRRMTPIDVWSSKLTQPAVFTGSQAEWLGHHIHGCTGPEDPYGSSSDYDQLFPVPMAPLKVKQISTLPRCRIERNVFESVVDGFDNMFLVEASSRQPGYYHIGCSSRHHVSHLLPNDPSVCICTHKAMLFGVTGVGLAAYFYEISIPDVGKVSYKFEGGDTDHVWCLPCQWPDKYKGIFTRENKGWPDKETLKFLAKYGRLFVVRKAHPRSKVPDTEFRLSFSVPEVILARSLPNEARHTYLTMRNLCHGIQQLAGYSLKTFHLKTILFWLVHECRITKWTREPSQLRRNILSLFSTLVHCLKTKRLRHFFIPEINLFDDFTSEECTRIGLELEEKLRKGLCFLIWLRYLTSRLHPECLPVHPTVRKQITRAEANAAFARWCKGRSLEGSGELFRQAKRLFDDGVKSWPSDTQILIDAGRFYKMSGDVVTSSILWLNALVLLEHSTLQTRYHSLFGGVYCTYEGVVRQLVMTDGGTYGQCVYAHTLATYLLVTAGCLRETSNTYLREKASQLLHRIVSSANLTKDVDQLSYSLFLVACLFYQHNLFTIAQIYFDYANASSRHLKLSFLLRAWSRENIEAQQANRCSEAGNEAVLSHLQHRVCSCMCRLYVYEVCAGVAEYVRDFRPRHVSGRRHSVDVMSRQWWNRLEDTRRMRDLLLNCLLDD